MITRNFLAGLTFRTMTEFDRMGFAGCTSPVSLIAEHNDGFADYLVVIDGSQCDVINVDSLEVVDLCEDIRELPYAPIVLDLGSGMYDAREGNEDSFSNLGMA
jgi:hypothetical protein